MKGLYCCILIVLLSSFCFGQSIQSSGGGSGNWNDPLSWTPNTVPTAANSTAVTINSGHLITVTDTRSIDQLVVNGSLVINNSVNLTINDGTATDLTVSSTGTLVNNGTLTIFIDPPPPPILNATVVVNGLFQNSGIISNASASRLTFSGSAAVYEHTYTDAAGTIPTATWSSGSTCLISGYTTNGAAPSGLGQAFENFTWDTGSSSAYINLNGALTTVNGNLTIRNVPTSYLFLSESISYTLNVGGDFTIENSYVGFNVSATPTINVTGNVLFANNGDLNFTYDGILTLDIEGDLEFADGVTNFSYGGTGSVPITLGGDFTLSSNPTLANGGSGVYTLTFDGQAIQNYFSAQALTDFDYLIENGSTVYVDDGYAFIGTGGFTLQSGGTLGVGSVNGLVTGTGSGNVQVSGARNYVANGNIIYYGDVAQNLGNEWGSSGDLSGVAVNLEIANTSSSGVTNNIIGSTSLVGNLTLTSGPFNIGNSNTLVIQSNFIGNGGTIGGLSSSNLTFSGSGTITGTLDFASGAQTLQNLTIDRAGIVRIGTDLTISTSGTLAFPSTGNLYFDQSTTQTLTINGNITQTGSGGLFTGTTIANTFPANLVIGGSGSLSELPFCSDCGTLTLTNVSLNRTGSVTYPWGTATRILGKLDLNSGTVAHSSGLIMTGTSTIELSAGTSVTLNPPNADPNYSVSYIGDMTTSLELPSIATHLNNLTVAGNVTLDKAIQVNGDLTINSGTLNASTFDLTMAGDDFIVAGGAFTMDPSKTITFSRSGSVTLSGSTISGTQFGNLTIASATTLVAPSGIINVSGTWDNLGNFSANGGTVAFNGASQNLDPNGQPFNHVTFAGTGTKQLQGPLDVNGILTITSTLDAGANQPINVGNSWINNGTFIAAAGTVTFDGTNQVINSNGQAFYNLELANTGTKVLGNALNIDGSITIASGVTLDASSSNYAINLAGNWTNNGTFARRLGTVTFDGTTVIGGSTSSNFHNVTVAGSLTASSGTSNIHGNWLHSSGTFNANNGTLQFIGGTQSITPGGQAFNHVVIGGTNTKTLQGNLDVNGNLSLTAAAFSVGADRTVNLAGNFDASGGGSLNAAAGLFVFDGANQSITSAGEIFHHATFSGSATKTLVDALDVNGDVNISSTLAAAANTINVAGNWNDTGTFTTTGTTVFDGAAQSIRSSGSAFGTLTLAGSGTKTLQDALDVNGDLTVTSGLDVSAGNYVVAVEGNWDTSVGTFNARAGEVRLNGAAQDVTVGTSDFFTLRISGTGTKTLQGAIDVNGDLIFENGTSALDVGNDQPIEIAGFWINDSGVNNAFIPGNGTVTFDGGVVSNVRGAGTTLFHSINVTGTTTVEIESAHNLKGTLTLVGNTSSFDAEGTSGDGVFTLISSDDDPTMDGRIAALPVPGNFTGDVTVQRFMSQESMPSQSNNRLYRYISSPVANASVSQIQSEIPVTGTFTGASSCSGCDASSQSMFGYDETVGSLFDDGWVAFPDASNTETLVRGSGYGIYVRGNILPSASWDVRGPVFSGDIASLPVTYTPMGVPGADGFNLVGNPYPSAIDWDLIHPTATNIADAIYIRDNANGRYAQYVNGVGANGGSKDIAMGQGFWVEAIGSNPVLPLTEGAKSSASTSFFREAPLPNILRIALANQDLSDETVIRFHDSATDLFDQAYDARKLRNTIFNLSSILTDNNQLSINTMGSMDCGREVKLNVADVTTGNYSLSLSGTDSFDGQVDIKLVDNYLGVMVDAKTTSLYGFNVDINKPETFGPERFRVIFEFKGNILEPEILTSDVCQGSDASLEISNSNLDVRYAIYANDNLIKDIGAGNGSNLVVTIPKDNLTAGDNVFELRAINSFCDQINIRHEFVIANEELPQISNAKGSTGCLSGSLSLTASGADEGNFRWYESLDDTSPLEGATGSVFLTPELSKTKTYYVAAVNNLGCEGPRVEVVAEIVHFEPVTLSETPSGQLVSNYAEGNQWYKDGVVIAGATGKTFTPTESGNYSVEVAIGTCISSAQQMFLVTANEEAFSNGRVNVYPNPVRNELTIETSIEQTEPPAIFDQTGRVIGTIHMVPSQNGWIGKYDFSEKTKGLYILRVLEKGLPKFKRIIKD